jgi:hypothetical protein
MMKFLTAFCSVLLMMLIGVGLVSPATAIAAPKQVVCNIDPSAVSPLGIRNTLNFKQLEDGTTVVTFERLPANVKNVRAKATIAAKRTLTMYEMPITSVREAFLAKPALYTELLGFQPEEGFKAVNALLVCQ